LFKLSYDIVAEEEGVGIDADVVFPVVFFFCRNIANGGITFYGRFVFQMRITYVIVSVVCVVEIITIGFGYGCCSASPTSAKLYLPVAWCPFVVG
jgi:hypothetical protein